MLTVPPVRIPLPTDIMIRLGKVVPGTEDIQKDIQYRELLGGLTYLTVISRPDIATAVNTMAKYSNSFNTDHWIYLKQILRYLSGTKELGITFGGGRTYLDTDSSFGDQKESGKSRAGYVLIVNGGPILYKTYVEKSVATSTYEAEIMAISHGVTALQPVISMREEINFPLKLPVTVRCDNTAAIIFAGGMTTTKKSRHINIRYYHIRQASLDGRINVTYISTKEQGADILTKLLCYDKHIIGRNALLNITSG